MAKGVVVSYVHNALAAGLGKIGVLVALESNGDAGKLAALGKQLAMHVAAANPQALDVKSLDPAQLERERNVLAEQARASGKPEEIVEPPPTVRTVADLIRWLAARGEEYAHAFDKPKVIRAAIDRKHVKPETAIAGAREVAFFPPMTGG